MPWVRTPLSSWLGPTPRGRRAFTLVEIMITVVIIGLLAAIAVPALKRVYVRARVTAFVSDLRQIESALNLYMQEQGSDLPDYQIGETPAELVPYLSKLKFNAPTPFSGVWDWDNHGTFQRICAVSGISEESTRLVDARIDDGDTSTGLVRWDGNFRYYVRESPPAP